MTTAVLQMTLPTTRADGSPLAPTDIDHIDIFDAMANDPSIPIGTLKPAGTTFTTSTLDVGMHHFAFTVTDTGGHVSAMSNVVDFSVEATGSPPSPGVLVSVTARP